MPLPLLCAEYINTLFAVSFEIQTTRVCMRACTVHGPIYCSRSQTYIVVKTQRDSEQWVRVVVQGDKVRTPIPFHVYPFPKTQPNILYYLLNIILPVHSNLGRSKKKNGQARPSPFVDMTRVMWDGDCWTTLSIFPYSTFLQSRRHRCRFSAQYVAALGSAKSQKCNMFERGG